MIFSTDCDYYGDKRDDEYSPYPGECEDCYRYEICKQFYDSTKINIKEYTPKEDSVFVIETNTDYLSHGIAKELNDMKESFKKKFPNIKFFMVPNIKNWNFKVYSKQDLINKLKEIIKELEESEELNNE